MFGFGFMREIREFSKAVRNFVCCLFCAGPILTIIGIVFLAIAAKNPRGSAISVYNGAVPTWVYSGYNKFVQLGPMTANMNGPYSVPLSQLLSMPDSPALETAAEIDTYTTRVRYAGTTNTSVLSGTYGGADVVLPTLNVYRSNGALVFQDTNVPLIFQYDSTVSCSSDESTSKCASRCSGTYIARRTCRFWYAITQMCYVLDGNTYVLDTSGSGCVTSPPDAGSRIATQNGLSRWGYQRYGSYPGGVSVGAVSVTVRSNLDPWVVAARLTSGSMHFGLTQAQYTAIGASCLVIGLVLALVPCIIIFWIVRCWRGRSGQKGMVLSPISAPTQPVAVPVAVPLQPVPSPYPPATGFANPVGYPTPSQGQPGAGYDQSAAMGYGQPPAGYPPSPAPGYGAPGYGAPAPGYGQPAPGYGQPAPGYGQPAPGYGQPAPGYGQPAPGYGQPAPGYGQVAPGYGSPAPGYAQPSGSPAYPPAVAPGYAKSV